MHGAETDEFAIHLVIGTLNALRQVGRIRSHKISYVNSFTTCDDSTLPFALASRKSLDALSSILNEDEYAFHLEIDAKGTISVAVP